MRTPRSSRRVANIKTEVAPPAKQSIVIQGDDEGENVKKGPVKALADIPKITLEKDLKSPENKSSSEEDKKVIMVLC
jgi:hypothetical protein